MKVTKKIEGEFLALLANGAPVIKACRRIGVSRKTLYHRRDDKPEFAEAWDEALEDGRQAKVAELEEEADRRAVEGVVVGVFKYKDKNLPKKRFSDTLLLARLKSLDPETYGDKSKVDATVRTEGISNPHLANLDQLSIDDQRAILEIIKRTSERQET